jgi:hypothetical protein
VFGSTDVDTLYDLLGPLHSYYTTKLNRNGPNSLGGGGNGSTVPYTTYRVFANGEGSSIGTNLCTYAGAAVATTTSVAACMGSTQPDTVGHESAHLMARYLRQDINGTWISLGTGVAGEPGTLNESMADFFGEAFELFHTGSHDWIIGGGYAVPIRNMADPPSQPLGIGQPPIADRYLSPDFYTGSADNGGVHQNAGVLNKASYLSVEGGVFNGFQVAGIGFDKVEQIWYRALTAYFEPGETFNQAYGHIIQAATDLYSADDVWQVTMALRSVEMNMSRSFAGDLDGNGVIDIADYVVWRHGRGTLYSQGVYDIWRANFGNPPSGSGAQLASVPEPVGWMLGLIGVAIISCCRALRVGGLG